MNTMEEVYKLYLAASYARREEMLAIVPALEHMGFEVTSRWLTGAHSISDAGGEEERHRFAQEDMEDIRAANALVLYNPPEDHRSGTGGRHVEVGYALCLGYCRVFIVGERENIFHWHNRVKYLQQATLANLPILLDAMREGGDL